MGRGSPVWVLLFHQMGNSEGQLNSSWQAVAQKTVWNRSLLEKIANSCFVGSLKIPTSLLAVCLKGTQQTFN